MAMDFDIYEFERLAQRFKILSEPTRLQILATLCGQERSVQEICLRTALNQANVSKHLRLMRDADIVACRRAGVWRYYRLIAPEILMLCKHVQKALSQSVNSAPPVNSTVKEIVGSS